MMHASPADIEFAQKGAVLVKARNPLMKRDDKIKILRGFIESLTQETFMVYSGKILDMINVKKERAEKYTTTEEQVSSIISEIPRFQLLKDDLIKRVKEARQEYGLES